jgi:polyhydroxyalkanoate synthesis regulator phasin
MENNKKIGFVAMVTSFAAGAVTMLLLSRKGRCKASQWADKMRDEITREAQKTKDMTEEKFDKIVDGIRPQYEAMKDIGSEELNSLVDELRSQWKTISQEAKKQTDTASQDQKQKKAPTASK